MHCVRHVDVTMVILLSESQIVVKAAYNGANWVATGLTGFQPTFLGQKFFEQLRGNQEKVVSACFRQPYSAERN